MGAMEVVFSYGSELIEGGCALWRHRDMIGRWRRATAARRVLRIPAPSMQHYPLLTMTLRFLLQRHNSYVIQAFITLNDFNQLSSRADNFVLLTDIYNFTA